MSNARACARIYARASHAYKRAAEVGLDIRCGKCHRHVVLSVESLTKRFDQSARIIEVVRRLKCDGFRCSNRCGGKPSRVVLVEVHVYGKSMRKVREVTVVGG
jgi:hypothetical protein